MIYKKIEKLKLNQKVKLLIISKRAKNYETKKSRRTT